VTIFLSRDFNRRRWTCSLAPLRQNCFPIQGGFRSFNEPMLARQRRGPSNAPRPNDRLRNNGTSSCFSPPQPPTPLDTSQPPLPLRLSNASFTTSSNGFLHFIFHRLLPHFVPCVLPSLISFYYLLQLPLLLHLLLPIMVFSTISSTVSSPTSCRVFYPSITSSSATSTALFTTSSNSFLYYLLPYFLLCLLPWFTLSPTLIPPCFLPASYPA
jgi:hypothetical protein